MCLQHSLKTYNPNGWDGLDLLRAFETILLSSHGTKIPHDSKIGGLSEEWSTATDVVKSGTRAIYLACNILNKAHRQGDVGTVSSILCVLASDRDSGSFLFSTTEKASLAMLSRRGNSRWL